MPGNEVSGFVNVPGLVKPKRRMALVLAALLSIMEAWIFVIWSDRFDRDVFDNEVLMLHVVLLRACEFFTCLSFV